MKYLWAAVLALTLTGPALADSYLCVADQATGFHFEGGKWTPANFNVSEKKYIFREHTYDSIALKIAGEAETTITEFGVFELGYDFPIFRCTAVRQHFKCRGGGEFFFHPKKGRYLKTDTVGYLYGDKDDSFSYPKVEIGRCSKI